MKTLTCSDAGFDCAAVIKGDTEDEIMSKAGEQAMKEHNIKAKDMTPELTQKRSSITLFSRSCCFPGRRGIISSPPYALFFYS